MLKVDIFNSSSEKINNSAVKITVTRTFLTLFADKPSELEINFVSEEEIAKLNQKYLKRLGPTDVISFPNANLDESVVSLGSLVICPSQVKKYQESLEEVITHGMVHLAGYDHETDLANWQEALNKIG